MSSSCVPTIRTTTASQLISLNERDRQRLLDVQRWTRLTDHERTFPTWGVAVGDYFFGADLGPLEDAVMPPPLASVLDECVDDSFDFTEETRERLKRSVYVGDYFQGVELLYNQNGGARMGYTVFGVNGVAPTLTSTTSRHYERYKVGDRFRRLTNVEYARLQGFAGEHCEAVDRRHQYVLYGNAVPPPMAEWALRRLLGSALDLALLPRAAQLELAI
jgi:DNA (cytosine-5)-methyltransferase 1